MTVTFKDKEEAIVAGVQRLKDLGLPRDAVDNGDMKWAFLNKGVIIMDDNRRRVLTIQEDILFSDAIHILFTPRGNN